MRLRLEGPIPPAIATLAESDLRTAFVRRGVELTRLEGATAATPEGALGIGAPAARSPATAREMVLTIGAATERLDQIVLTLEGAGASTLTRRLNLTPVPADGRVLALVVAADEMLVASADERLVRRRAADAAPPSSGPATAPVAASTPAVEPAPEAAASPNAGAPAKPPAEPPAPAPLATVATTAGTAAAPRHRPASTVAATFAFDHFNGGQTHLGFDLGGSRRVGSRFFGVLAAQGRQALSASTDAGDTVGARLLGVRLAAGVDLIADGGPLWLRVDLGARAGRLWFNGRTQDTTRVGRKPEAYLVYADAMLTLDVRLGRSPLALRLSIGGGAPLLAQIAGERPAPTGGNTNITPLTGATGAAFESQGGIVLSL